MAKGSSEARFREALGSIPDVRYVYKPADDGRNWKPCDFMVWFRDEEEDLPAPCQSAWLEVKDAGKALRSWNAKSQLRPSQRNGIRDADEMRIPYWLAIWWPRAGRWTISDATRMDLGEPSFTFMQLSSALGVECVPSMLASTIRMALLGGIF